MNQNASKRISDNDPRFTVLTKKTFPHTVQYYNSTENIVKALVSATKYNASIAFAIDAFSEYHIEVLAWMYGVKEASIKIAKESKKAPDFALTTVVSSQFNTLQEKFDAIHEDIIKRFENAVKKLLKRKKSTVKQRNQLSLKILNQLKKQLHEYEMTVRNARSMLRSTLSFL